MKLIVGILSFLLGIYNVTKLYKQDSLKLKESFYDRFSFARLWRQYANAK